MLTLLPFCSTQNSVDMYAIYTGSAQDVSFLIDLLPAVLFPEGEHEVAQWLAAGVSLGGHAVWALLASGASVVSSISLLRSGTQRLAD